MADTVSPFFLSLRSTPGKAKARRFVPSCIVFLASHPLAAPPDSILDIQRKTPEVRRSCTKGKDDFYTHFEWRSREFPPWLLLYPPKHFVFSLNTCEWVSRWSFGSKRFTNSFLRTIGVFFSRRGDTWLLLDDLKAPPRRMGHKCEASVSAFLQCRAHAKVELGTTILCVKNARPGSRLQRPVGIPFGLAYFITNHYFNVGKILGHILYTQIISPKKFVHVQMKKFNFGDWGCLLSPKPESPTKALFEFHAMAWIIPISVLFIWHLYGWDYRIIFLKLLERLKGAPKLREMPQTVKSSAI